MLFRTIAILASIFLIAAPVASKRDMHIESGTSVARNGYQGGL